MGYWIPKKKQKNGIRRLPFLGGLLGCTTGSYWHGTTKKRMIIHGVLRSFVSVIGRERIFVFLDKFKNKLALADANYVGDMSSRVRIMDSRVGKNMHITAKTIPFEGFDFKVPRNYKEYLIQLYGESA